MDTNRNIDVKTIVDPNHNTDVKTIMDFNRKCIPEEILFDIITRLSLKSLCRFRCVSKSWLSFVSNPDFVAAYLTRSRSRPKLLISVECKKKKMWNFFSIDYPEQSDKQPLHLHATYCSSTELGDFPMMISQSPDGLICFSCSQGIKIGNPITGDFGVIPYPICSRIRSFFFGFDPVEKRQVILKVEKGDVKPSSVFDLLDNTWHKTQPNPLLMFYDSDDICINGVIYFTSFYLRYSPSFSIDKCLYAFDVRLKSFKRILRPPNSLGQLFVVELLIEYKGRVALVGYGDSRDTSVDDIKMWILEDVDNHIWSFKSFVVPWSENLMKDGISIDGMQTWDSYSSDRVKVKVNLLGATHKGELILATSLWNRSPYLFFYDIETKMLRRFQVDGFGKTPCRIVRFNLVIESLQSVPEWSEKKKRSRKRERDGFIN